MPLTRRRGREIALGVVGAVCAMAIGAIAFAFIIHPSPPPSLGASVDVEEVPVTQQEFRDDRGATLIVTRGPDVELRIRTGGLITDTTCESGGALTSGTSAFQVDGRPVVNLHTSVPLWRELSVGDAGEDVRALETGLRQLGIEIRDDATLQWSDVAALRSVFAKAGADADFDTVSPSRIIWLPARDVRVAQCVNAVGAAVASEDVVATIDGSATVAVMGLAAERLPGPRELLLDDVTVALDDALVPDAEAVAALLATSAYESAARESSDGSPVSVPVDVRLVAAVTVAALVPASVTSDPDGKACVMGDGEQIPVRIVSSEMGRTLVQFDDEPPEVVTIRGPGSCD